MQTSFISNLLFFSLSIVLLLTHGAMGLQPATEHYTRLLRSMLPSTQRALLHGTRRLQQSSLSEYPFEVLNNVNMSECITSGASCLTNDFVLLTDAAPRPESDAGRLYLKIAAAMYQCGAYKSAAQCTANGCELIETQGEGINNSTMVEGCWADTSAVASDILTHSFCRGSLAEKLGACMGMKDGSFFSQDTTSGISLTSTACVSKDGVTCESISGMCIPSDLKDSYDVTSQTGSQRLLQDVQSFSEKFWGCCSGRNLFQIANTCMTQPTQSSCRATGQCVWEESECTIDTNSATFEDLFMGAKTSMGEFYSKANTKCKQITDPKTCMSQPSVTNINQTKVSEYAKMEVKGGSDSTSCKSKSGASGSANAAIPTGGKLQGVMAAGVAVFVAAGLITSGL